MFDLISFKGILFFAFSTIAVVSSLMVIFKKNPVSSAFSLVLVLFSFAGIYALIGAHTMAAFQVLVYAGAIMVLFVFVIMLLNQGDKDALADENLEDGSLIFKIGAGLVSVGVAALLIFAFLNIKDIKPIGNLTAEEMETQGGNLMVLSKSIFTQYVFHFELISFLILGAVVGTIALAKRNSSKDKEGAST